MSPIPNSSVREHNAFVRGIHIGSAKTGEKSPPSFPILRATIRRTWESGTRHQRLGGCCGGQGRHHLCDVACDAAGTGQIHTEKVIVRVGRTDLFATGGKQVLPSWHLMFLIQ